MKNKKKTKIAVIFTAVLITGVLIVHFLLSLHQPLYFLSDDTVESISIYKTYRNKENKFVEIPKEDIPYLVSLFKTVKVEDSTKQKHIMSTSPYITFKVKFKIGITLNVKCIGKYTFSVSKRLWHIDKECESFTALGAYAKENKYV